LIPGDVGRPLADLHALSSDRTLNEDARAVLRGSKVIDCEVEAAGEISFMRRILPYRTDAGGVEGVVITFVDITERKITRKALELAKREAEQANLAKSRFLAAASHDLRQPLQSLALLQGLLTRVVDGERAHTLIGRLDQTLATMSGMLNTMLDINQIEAGIVCAEPVDFVIGELIDRVCGEFADQAQAQALELCSVHSSRVIHSDPAMIEQMLRNLVSNALKYTKRGKILLGCRQHGNILKIEVWDTGVGIAAAELDAIFDEYHQIDNAARERSLGLGLGLSIVQRLGKLLSHRVGVRSLPRRGSVFSIEVLLVQQGAARVVNRPMQHVDPVTAAVPILTGTILIVDDDPELRDLLEQLLKSDGHRTIVASDGIAALHFVKHGALRPDLVLADYNLPNAMTGLQVVAQVRDTLHRPVPAIILTGDISTATLRGIAEQNCLQLNKPVKPADLARAIQSLLPTSRPADHDLVEAARGTAIPTIFIVDDDAAVREGLRELLEGADLAVEDFADCESFLATYRPVGEACLLIDAYLPGMNGVELLEKLRDTGQRLSAIMITGSSDIPIAVEAMKAGACDFIEKPVGCDELLASVHHALELSRDADKLGAWRKSAVDQMASLTRRQRQVLGLVLAGHPSKNIASDLGISQRTVENHRATIMHKTCSRSLPALARLAVAAGWPEAVPQTAGGTE
jgi:two-component system CheB/CheR fusion protein